MNMKTKIISTLIFLSALPAFAAFEFKTFDKKVGDVIISFVHNDRNAEVYYSTKADGKSVPVRR